MSKKGWFTHKDLSFRFREIELDKEFCWQIADKGLLSLHIANLYESELIRFILCNIKLKVVKL